MKRYHVNKRFDKKKFKHTAGRSKSINQGPAPRGGYRL